MKGKITAILTKQVKGLGDAYETVHVPHGYFRNYLLPRKLAVLATGEALARVEALRAQQDRERETRRAAAQQAAERLSGAPLTFARKGEGDTLYGSVSAKDIAHALAEQGFGEATVSTEPLKSFGTHQVAVDFGDGVAGTATVEITKEEP